MSDFKIPPRAETSTTIHYLTPPTHTEIIKLGQQLMNTLFTTHYPDEFIARGSKSGPEYVRPEAKQPNAVYADVPCAKACDRRTEPVRDGRPFDFIGTTWPERDELSKTIRRLEDLRLQYLNLLRHARNLIDGEVKRLGA